MGKITRYLLIAAMITATGLILYFPPGSVWYIVGFGLIIAGVAMVWIAAKEKEKKKK